MASSMFRYRWLPILVAAVLLVPLAIGMSSAGAAAGTATASKLKTVKIVSFAYQPTTLTIAKGSSVSFSNISTATHTATRDGAFDTGRIKPGKSVTVRFRQKGSFPYHCLIHPSMHGKIVVD